MNGNNATYFDSFGVKLIPKEVKKLIGNKNLITNIYTKQGHDSIMYDFMIKDKSFLDYTNSFSPYDYEKNDKIILKYFQ